MQVSRVNNFTIQDKRCYKQANVSPAFTSVGGSISDAAGKFMYRIDTSFFRFDMPWGVFAKFIAERFNKAPKVNVIDHACSIGYEPYSIAMALKTTVGAQAKKFFPIKARDIDANNIRLAKEGFFKVDDYEKMGVDFYTKHRFPEFFKIDPTNVFTKIYRPTEQIKSTVEFKQSNILNDLRKIAKKNTVLLCRNFWPYLEAKDAANLAEKLATKMRKNSLLVIGEYDKSFRINKMLESFGFKETDIEGVFEVPGRGRQTRKTAKLAKEKFLSSTPEGQICKDFNDLNTAVKFDMQEYIANY